MSDDNQDKKPIAPPPQPKFGGTVDRTPAANRSAAPQQSAASSQESGLGEIIKSIFNLFKRGGGNK